MLNSLASAGRRALPNQWDLIAFAAILAVLTAIAKSYHGISAPLPAASESTISLDYWQLPYYALRTTLRMFAALAASLIFTFTYATLAAKSRRAELILIPVLDVLQSVPVLGFLSFTVTFFLGLFPGNTMGAELAAVFAIFSLVMGALAGPKRWNRAKLEAYECGIEPTRQPSGIRFPVKYYLTAMLFIVFDIEIIFLYPWAVAFDRLGVFGLVEMVTFIATVLVAYAYVWRRGGLEWD